MPTIGDRIHERRIALDWTLERLAKDADVGKGFLSDLENGKRKNASANYLIAIARALDVSVDYLVTGGTAAPKGGEVKMPSSLVEFAKRMNLSFPQTMMLLDSRRQIEAHRSDSKSDDLEEFDWKPFYEALKPYLK